MKIYKNLNPIKLIAIPVVVLVAAAAFALPASAATPTRYITVNAEGVVQVTPDAVRLNATVTNIAPTSAAALSQTSAAAAKVRAALKAKMIETKDVKTTSITVYPEYNYTQDQGSVQIGYRASQSFEVVIRDATKAGEIVDALVASAGDALYINGVTPFILDNTSAIDAARVTAVKSAKSKAKSYAKLLGVKIGKIIWLQESSAPTSYPSSMVQAKSDFGATQIDLGEQDLSVSVSTRWAIS